MKVKRNLSGVYLRYYNEETAQMENRCFEDLSRQEQLNHLAGEEQSYILRLAMTLADTINRIGDELDLEAN